MRLWRVTGKDGKGFYFSELRSGLKMSEAVSEYLGRDVGEMNAQHPRPSDDGIMDVEDHHFFAFSSMSQLHAWFDPAMFSASCKNGAMLEVWEVSPHYVKKGKKQVCFEKDKATRVEVTKLENHKLRR